MLIDELQLYRGDNYKVNDYIIIRQPTLGEICDFGEQRYFYVVSTICATPSEYKVQLHDMGIDYEEIREFEFFAMLSKTLTVEDTSIILGDIDLSNFMPMQDRETGEMVLYDVVNNFILDFLAYNLMTNFLRKMHGFKKIVDKAGNAATKRILIETEKRSLKRQKSKKYKSILVPLISSMVNCDHFKYNHSNVWDLPIYAFMDSVKRVQKIKNCDQLIQGAYSGNIDLKKIPREDLNWLGSIDD